MKVWTVDAQDVNNVSDDLLYTTPWIESFLSKDTTKFFVVASKGFGKTLLLRAKRQRLQEERRGALLLPEHAMVDKPLGFVPIFSWHDVQRLNHDPAFWEGAWLIATTLAIIKASQSNHASPQRITPADLESDLAKVLSGRLTTITDIFARIVSLSPKEYHRAQQDLQNTLGPVFREIHTPVVAFIDNVDEHFNPHIKHERSASVGATDKSFWYLAQTGLASAIRKLHGQNPHVKIFASVRSEAFAQLLHHSQIRQQLEGSSVRIEYQPEELREIFVRNLAAEPDSNCAMPKSHDPFERFFGKDNMLIVHPRVNEPEKIWDYILRHTLGRPRDLMSIGARISKLRPTLRSTEALRRAVNDASQNIAEAYLDEIGVHLTNSIDYARLFPLITKNVLSRHDMVAIATQYNAGAGPNATPASYVHVFCSLYKAGLLGYIVRDVGTGELAQRFERPGALLFAADGLLPSSDHYIIHPALDSHVKLRSRRYVQGMDTLNIAGDARPWREARHESGVIKADVVGFSRFMLDPGASRTFTKDLKKIVRECSGKLTSFRIEGGDTVVLVDKNAANLFAAIREIAARLREGPYSAQIRAGADFGRADEGGLAFRTAARLEVVGEPDHLMATKEFAEQLELIDDRHDSVDLSTIKSLSTLERHGSTVNLRKNSADPALFKELVAFRLSPP